MRLLATPSPRTVKYNTEVVRPVVSQRTSVEQIDRWRLVESETEHLEFKEAKTQFDFEELLKYCVAIANERGGILLLGIANKPPRAVVGTNAFLAVPKTAHDIFTKLRFRVDVEDVQHPRGRVLVFRIPSRPPRTPYQYKGQFLMRVGESLTGMTPEQLERIFKEDVPTVREKKRWARSMSVIIPVVAVGLISLMYWYALHKPRQRDVETGPPAEKLTLTPNVTAIVQRDWHNKKNWRTYLRLGMTKTQVRQTFGEPERVDVTLELQVWKYGSGEIEFTVDSDNPDGKLYSWSEPENDAQQAPSSAVKNNHSP